MGFGGDGGGGGGVGGFGWSMRTSPSIWLPSMAMADVVCCEVGAWWRRPRIALFDKAIEEGDR